MDRKQVKKDRIRRLFLDAAKEIIRTEGVENLTTKKIGDKAAYSYASIYNYFDNYNDLVCQCMEEMAAETALWVKERIAGDKPYDRLLSCARLMIQANASNPNVYSIFLSTNIDYGYFLRRDGHHFVHPTYIMLLEELSQFPEFRTAAAPVGAPPIPPPGSGEGEDEARRLSSFEAGLEDASMHDVRVLADILTYTFHSKLHFYLRYHTPASLNELQSDVEEECRFVIDSALARAKLKG